MLDYDLTRGYIQTAMIMKSQRYTSTNISQYIGFDFVGHFAATMLGVYWIFYFIYWCMPVGMNSELDQIEKVYRVQESDDTTNVMQLKNAM